MKKQIKKTKKLSDTEQYQKDFLQQTGFISKTGKSVYISEEFHRYISRIVFVIGDGKVTITDYLFNVLKLHFQEFGEEIKTLYSEKDKPIL